MELEEFERLLKQNGHVNLSPEESISIQKQRIERDERLLLKAYAEKDWEEFEKAVIWDHYLQPLALSICDAMPEDRRRAFIIDCYTDHGDNLPICRRLVRQLPKRGREELPEEYRSRELITVYRAGTEDKKQARRKLSWSISKDALKYFIEYKKALGQNVRIYQGEISPDDVIAYTNDRQEQEILQYCKVVNIQDITDTELTKGQEKTETVI